MTKNDIYWSFYINYYTTLLLNYYILSYIYMNYYKLRYRVKCLLKGLLVTLSSTEMLYWHLGVF